MSAVECLQNRYFDPIRLPDNEKTTRNNKIELDVDRDEAFDYMNGHSSLFSCEDYKNKIKKLNNTITR